MIRLRNVTKNYENGVEALSNISMEIQNGEFVFIVGDSGSGKSTLIKLLLKEVEPTDGTIEVDGIVLNKMKRKYVPMYRRKIGCVFQEFRLLKDRNVYENVAFAQRVVGTATENIRKDVPKILATVGLAEKYRSLPAQLSGGEQQRVALARALVNKPSIILADEPTGSLDSGNSEIVLQHLHRLNEEGKTVILVTHDEKIIESERKVVRL